MKKSPKSFFTDFQYILIRCRKHMERVEDYKKSRILLMSYFFE